MISEAISNDENEVDLASNPDAYVTADITSNSADLQATVDAYNNFAKASITYIFGDETVTLDGTTIKDWLQFDEKGQLIQDDASFKQHIVDYVAQLGGKLMIQLELRDSPDNKRKNRTGIRFPMAGRSTRMVRLPAYSRRSSPVPRQRESLYIPCAPMLTESTISVNNLYRSGSYRTVYVVLSGRKCGSLSPTLYPDLQVDPERKPPGIFFNAMYHKKSPDCSGGTKKADGTLFLWAAGNILMPFNGGIGFHDADWQPYFGGRQISYRRFIHGWD